MSESVQRLENKEKEPLEDTDYLIPYIFRIRELEGKEDLEVDQRCFNSAISYFIDLDHVQKNLLELQKDKSEELNPSYYPCLNSTLVNIHDNRYYLPLNSFSPYLDIFFRISSRKRLSDSQDQLRLLQDLHSALNTDDFKKEIKKHRKENREKVNKLSRYLESLFINSPSLLVINLDLGYSSKVSCLHEEPISEENLKKVEEVQEHRKKLFDSIKKKYKNDLVGYMWKLDYVEEYNFRYRTIFFMDGEKYQDDTELVQWIETAWKEITQQNGRVDQCSKSPYIYFYFNGLIKKDELEKLKILKKNVLSFVSIDEITSMTISSKDGKKYHTFDRSQIKKKISKKS